MLSHQTTFCNVHDVSINNMNAPWGNCIINIMLYLYLLVAIQKQNSKVLNLESTASSETSTFNFETRVYYTLEMHEDFWVFLRGVVKSWFDNTTSHVSNTTSHVSSLILGLVLQ